MDWGRLQLAIGYRFVQPALLTQALTHRSHGTPHNERLEFLGDSILNCVIAAELCSRFGSAREGDLSRLRANLVRQETLHQIAQALALGECLRLGEGELKSGGYARPSILADALEALFGAVFLDGGFDSAQETILRLYAGALGEVDPSASGKDPKTMLQELLQARHIALPKYVVVSTSGAAHSQQFEVECAIPELSVRTTGSGNSRRVAEQEAAQRAYAEIRK
jgi:ribonuclease-3